MCGLAHRHSSFPPGTFAPYQVRLDKGKKLIYAPIDEDRVCRAYTGEAAPSRRKTEDEEEKEAEEDEDEEWEEAFFAAQVELAPDEEEDDEMEDEEEGGEDEEDEDEEDEDEDKEDHARPTYLFRLHQLRLMRSWRAPLHWPLCRGQAPLRLLHPLRAETEDEEEEEAEEKVDQMVHYIAKVDLTLKP